MYAKRKNIRIVAGLLIVGLLVLIGQSRHLQEDYASEVFRFHVIANSDTEEDQALKLQVRDQVGAYVSGLLATASDKKETESIIRAHLKEIEKVAGQEIAKEGYTYPVTAAIEDVDFPEKFYGIYHLPAGNYTSLQVRIGQAQGKNWWCVLYPGLCRSACGGYARPAENDLVCGNYILRLRLVEWVQQRTARREDVVLVG